MEVAENIFNFKKDHKAEFKRLVKLEINQREIQNSLKLLKQKHSEKSNWEF